MPSLPPGGEAERWKSPEEREEGRRGKKFEEKHRNRKERRGLKREGGKGGGIEGKEVIGMLTATEERTLRDESLSEYQRANRLRAHIHYEKKRALEALDIVLKALEALGMKEEMKEVEEEKEWWRRLRLPWVSERSFSLARVKEVLEEVARRRERVWRWLERWPPEALRDLARRDPEGLMRFVVYSIRRSPVLREMVKRGGLFRCEECGRPIAPRRIDQRFCSRACKDRFLARRRRALTR